MFTPMYVSEFYQVSVSGSRRAKMTHKNRKKLRKFMFLKCWMFFFKGSRILSCSLDVLYGDLGISKLQLLIKKCKHLFSCRFFVIFCHQNPESGLELSLKCWIRKQ